MDKTCFYHEPHLPRLTATQPLNLCISDLYASAAHPELRHFPRRWVTPSCRAAAWPRSMAVAGELPPPAAVLPSFAAACALVCRRYSCLVVAPHRRHVALPPRFLGRKRTGICAQLDAELLRYSERWGSRVRQPSVRLGGGGPAANCACP